MKHDFPKTWMYALLLWSSLSLSLSAKEAQEDKANEGEKQPWFVDKPYEPISNEKKKAICREYRRSYISYYSRVFQTDQNCIARELDAQEVSKVMSQGQRIKEVDSQVLEAHRVTEPSTPQASSKPSSICKEYEGKYIRLELDVEHYLVENCKKRKFPDRDTFESHRGGIVSKKPIHSVSYQIFSALANGVSFPSVIDKEYQRYVGDSPIEVLSVDEACLGLIGKLAAYAGKLFSLHQIPGKPRGHCYKKVIQDAEYTRSKLGHVKVETMNRSQWVSIPNMSNESETPF